ncbi:MAG: hypothetical protein WD595_03135 [Waddliaceae bacterium]
MSKHYLSYSWKNGTPYGISSVESPKKDQVTFLILSDPYLKRISVEKCIGGLFESLIYDSYLLDFRKLRPEFQLAWGRESLNEGVNLVRDQDDRVVVKEICTFDGNRCRQCDLYSPHGFLLGIQMIHYKELGDPYNGVTLYDALHQPVLIKKYSLNTETGFFDKLEEELKSF